MKTPRHLSERSSVMTLDASAQYIGKKSSAGTSVQIGC